MRTADGQLLADDQQLHVIGCRRPDDDAQTLCSYGSFSNVVDLIDPATGLPLLAVDVLEWGLTGLAASETPPRASLRDTSATPMWPDSEWVQPLEGIGAP